MVTLETQFGGSGASEQVQPELAHVSGLKESRSIDQAPIEKHPPTQGSRRRSIFQGHSNCSMCKRLWAMPGRRPLLLAVPVGQSGTQVPLRWDDRSD